MISYRDMTFCPYWGACEDGKDCPKALTKQVSYDAIRWWKSMRPEEVENAPIMVFADAPQCYKEMRP